MRRTGVSTLARLGIDSVVADKLGGGKDSRQILTHGQLRLFDASLVGAAAARTAATRAKAPMPSPAVQRSAEPCAD